MASKVQDLIVRIPAPDPGIHHPILLKPAPPSIRAIRKIRAIRGLPLRCPQANDLGPANRSCLFPCPNLMAPLKVPAGFPFAVSFEDVQPASGLASQLAGLEQRRLFAA